MERPVITAYCIIRHREIICDGKTIYSSQAGTLKDFLQQAYDFIKPEYPKFYKMDHLSQLGLLAAEVLLKNRSLSAEYPAESISVVLSNAHSSLDTDLRYLASTKTMASPALFVYTLPNIVAGEICIRHKIKGENAFFISPAFDPEWMVDYVSTVFSSIPNTPACASASAGRQCLISNACIAGWVDLVGEHHDVFLYLLEKNKQPSLEHSAEKLKELYNTRYGTIDGQSEKADH
jgi:hypothetical protein